MENKQINAAQDVGNEFNTEEAHIFFDAEQEVLYAADAEDRRSVTGFVFTMSEKTSIELKKAASSSPIDERSLCSSRMTMVINGFKDEIVPGTPNFLWQPKRFVPSKVKHLFLIFVYAFL